MLRNFLKESDFIFFCAEQNFVKNHISVKGKLRFLPWVAWADPGMGRPAPPPPPLWTAKSCKFSLFWGYISQFPPNFDTVPSFLQILDGPGLCSSRYTVKQVNFTGTLFSQIGNYCCFCRHCATKKKKMENLVTVNLKVTMSRQVIFSNLGLLWN